MSPTFNLIKIIQEKYNNPNSGFLGIDTREFNFDGRTYSLKMIAKDGFATIHIANDKLECGIYYKDQDKQLTIIEHEFYKNIDVISFDVKKNIQDHDDTEILLLLGKKYTDESLIKLMFGE